MFVFAETDLGTCTLIPQVSHAWMAWQVAEHWGNREFARPNPKAEVLAAVLLHDNGWAEFDTAPGIDSNGRVHTFDRMPPQAHIELWRRSVSRSAMYARYAGMLVAAHLSRLAEMKGADKIRSGETSAARASHSFKAELERLQAGWREELANDARFAPFLKGQGWETNNRLLAACDLISVRLCAAMPGPFSVEAMATSGEVVSVRFEPVEQRTWRVQPWPLMGDRLRLRCEGRRLARTSFDSAQELHEMLAHAPGERLAFTLLRRSARA